MFHLFGNILTRYGTAANNRGQNEGNLSPLKKLIWKGEVHSYVSSEAIRFSLRHYWQESGYNVNRSWDEDNQDNNWQNPDFDPVTFIDDDVLGYMKAEAAKIEISDEIDVGEEIETKPSEEQKAKKKRKPKPKGTIRPRRGALEVVHAVSTLPYFDDITFNAASGAKGRTSLYSTEFHATSYQYGFALTPEHLKNKSRINAVLDGFISIGRVAGNNARFRFDYSPSIIVLRWTHDFSPRFFYCFEQNQLGQVSISDLVETVQAGDIDPKELWVGGVKNFEILQDLGMNVFPGVKSAVTALKQVIAEDLQLPLGS
ncbi:MAG: DevR family CRISPR-associated autoregulator [Calothrix sp. FI2-JRJ7]|jgi:CRISPR-associated protein Cst2|nr:DevR family CRISPR-associated autoregulator [Calothrix sp. FI2-JRJ7]